jgi:hypothetical protein
MFPGLSWLATRPARFRFARAQQLPRRVAFQNLALVHPTLDADDAVCRMRFGEAVVDVGAQCVQRKLPVQIPFRPRDFGSIQSARHAHLDTLATEPLRRIYRLSHRSPECNALFQLEGNRFRNQLRIQFRFVNFLDVDEDFALGALRQI